MGAGVPNHSRFFRGPRDSSADFGMTLGSHPERSEASHGERACEGAPGRSAAPLTPALSLEGEGATARRANALRVDPRPMRFLAGHRNSG